MGALYDIDKASRFVVVLSLLLLLHHLLGHLSNMLKLSECTVLFEVELLPERARLMEALCGHRLYYYNSVHFYSSNHKVVRMGDYNC